MDVEILPSLAALEAAAPAWDDLWCRSDVASPLCRAERVVAWCRQFAPWAEFRAVVVTQGSRFVAALPLLQASRLVPKLGRAPNNHWSATGDLLVERGADLEEVARFIAAGFRLLPWSCVICRVMPCASPAWRAFAAVAPEEGLSLHVESTDAIGTLRLDPAGPGLIRHGTRNHRRNLQRALRRVEAAGGRTLRVFRPTAPADATRLLDAGFALEDSGWKRRRGTSVVRVAGMRDYYAEEARALAASGDLILYFLDQADQPIAFQYAYRGKDRVFLSKMGYDERHAWVSPGHILTLDLLDELAGRGEALTVEFGPMNEATARWVDESYPLGTVIVARNNAAGRVLFGSLCTALRWKHRQHGEPTARDGRSLASD